MDLSARPRRGGVGKRLVASSFLLELGPDVQTPENRRHRNPHSDSQFQLPTRQPEEHAQRQYGGQDYHSLSQHGWGGRMEERLPVAATTKRRLSRSKRRSLSLDQSTVSTANTLDPVPTHENIIFAESPLNPGVPIVYRPPEVKSVNPDRLNLDRRHLTVCPFLEGEERLRLLNLQHNTITRLQNLGNLRRLVFLDVYDNLVHDMSGLEGLLSLRVLMLGKNRIRKISGLQSLMRLDVLDLHGNMIREVESLDHLTHLRVLNLAGNEITCVSSLAGLSALAELNFRRNRITHVYDIDQLPKLQRLFLSHNLIQSFTDMKCLSRCSSLHELSLDGNPVANSPDHRPSTIFHVRCLKSLDQAVVLDEEREEATASLREEEEKQKEQRRRVLQEEHREAAIAAICKSWDSTHADLDPPVLSQSSHDLTSHSEKSTKSCQPLKPSFSLPHLLPTFLVDLSASTLHIYGSGALEALDTPPRDSEPITALHFHCLEFRDLVPWVEKIARTFLDLDSVCLEYTNMTTLDELNSLSSLPSPLHTLTITPHGNPLTHHSLFTHYLFYRLHHLNLTTLNGAPVTQDDITAAHRVFESLGKMTTSRLQPARLASLALHHRPRNSHRGSRTVPLAEKRRMEEPLDRVALHVPSQRNDKAHQVRRAAAHSFSTGLHSACLEAHGKLGVLQTVWPDVLASLVQQALRDYSQLDTAMATMLDHL